MAGLTDRISVPIKAEVPSFKVKYKDQSFFMKLLGFLSYVFNQRFMEDFTTTIGMTVYFPSKEWADSRDESCAKILAHEFVHLWDSKRQWLRYNLGYMSPQVWIIPLLTAYAILFSWIPIAVFGGGVVAAYLLMLGAMGITSNVYVRLGVFYLVAFLAVAAYIGLAVWLTKWWAFLAVGALLPIGPWYAPWRAKWEYRGYGMGIAWSVWTRGDVSERRLEYTSARFTGMDYFRMDPKKSRVMAELSDIAKRCRSGQVLDGDAAKPYCVINEFLDSEGMLHGS